MLRGRAVLRILEGKEGRKEGRDFCKISYLMTIDEKKRKEGT